MQWRRFDFTSKLFHKIRKTSRTPAIIVISYYCKFLNLRCLQEWKLFKCGVISSQYFSAFGLNTAKYGPEITPYLDTFHAVYGMFIKNIPVENSVYSKQNVCFTDLFLLELNFQVTFFLEIHKIPICHLDVQNQQ